MNYQEQSSQYQTSIELVENINDNSRGITFVCGGNEMLRVSPTGFYVRGQLLKQDDTESAQVYNSFTQWLAWQQLTR